MRSAYKEYAVPMRPNTLGAWLEAIIITLGAMLLGYFYSPADPLLIKADFPWMIFAPLLLAVRYGFLPGLLSVCLIIIGLFISSGMLLGNLPKSYIIGMLLAVFLVGEFRDIWHKKLMTLYMANEYRQYRLDDFTRSYRLLKVSHDELELRISGSNRSLRSTLLMLYRTLQKADLNQQNNLAAIAEQTMQVFSQYGSFTSAGLYSFDENYSLSLKPLAVLGNMAKLSIDDVLLQACLKTKQTVSVRDELLNKGANPSQLQVCVPLLDTEQNWVGILAIAQIPFFSMTDQTLNLLTLLSGFVADILQVDKKTIQLNSPQAQYFSKQLQRASLNTKKYNLSAAVCAFEFDKDNTALRQALEQSQRGLDLQLDLINSRDRYLLLVLLPLTSGKGLLSYLDRIAALVDQQYPDMGLLNTNVSVLKLQLDQASTADLKKFIYQECGLDEQQLVV